MNRPDPRRVENDLPILLLTCLVNHADGTRIKDSDKRIIRLGRHLVGSARNQWAIDVEK